MHNSDDALWLDEENIDNSHITNTSQIECLPSQWQIISKTDMVVWAQYD